MAAASGEHNAANWGSTDQTRLTFTAINSVLELEKSFFSISIDVIGDGRATERDRFAQHFLYCGVQLAQLIDREGRRTPTGTDPGAR